MLSTAATQNIKVDSVKQKPKVSKFRSFLLNLVLWTIFFTFFWQFFAPAELMMRILNVDSLGYRTDLIITYMILWLIALYTVGLGVCIKRSVSFWCFPFVLAFKLLKFTYKFFTGAFRIHSRPSTIALSILLCLAIVLGAIATDNQTALNTLSWVSIALALSVNGRMAFRSMGPATLLDKAVGKFIEFGEKHNLIRKFVISQLRKKSSDADPKTFEGDLKRLEKFLGYAGGVPDLIQEARFPLLLFLTEFLGSVFILTILYAVMAKAALVAVYPTLSNYEYFLIILFQFTGSNMHGLPTDLDNARNVLSGVSANQIFLFAIVMFAASYTMPSHIQKVSKRLRSHLTLKASETVNTIREEFQEELSAEQIMRVQSMLAGLFNLPLPAKISSEGTWN